MSHLTHMKDVIELAELTSGKKLDQRKVHPFEGMQKNTWGDGYQRAANLDVDIIFKDSFQLNPEH